MHARSSEQPPTHHYAGTLIRVLAYGSGNVKAITNIYKRLNIPCGEASHADQLHDAERIILPGVGAFDQVMSMLEGSGMLDTVNTLVQERSVPVLGVCVGMQIMADGSEEGERPGLGWIPGQVREIDVSALDHKPRLPHMGWNAIEPRSTAPILEGIDPDRGFYFLHTYCYTCRDDAHVLATSQYGQEFASAIGSGSIYGFQFHPEKSHQNGITIFRNFARA